MARCGCWAHGRRMPRRWPSEALDEGTRRSLALKPLTSRSRFGGQFGRLPANFVFGGMFSDPLGIRQASFGDCPPVALTVSPGVVRASYPACASPRTLNGLRDSMVDRPSSGETYAYKRRSTRLLHTVPVSVAGQDAAGRPLAEQTATISLNCHGCRYFSRFRVERNSWLTLEIPGAPPREPSRRLRARVAWIEKSRRLAGLFQVAVEFESPANVWGITKPPQDWQDFVTAAALDHAATQAEINRLLAVTKNGNYYELLGVSAVSSHAQIRGRFYDLARKFHPDRHMSHPEWTDSLHRLMDTLTLAYKTLSNDKAREQYDRRLASSGAFTLGHSKSETQKTAEECLAKGRECLRMQNFAGSIVWLRKAV